MKTKKMTAGTITIGSRIRVSDPCYDKDTWCAGTIENVLPGEYDCFYILFDDGDWGKRVAELEIRHQDYLHIYADKAEDIDVGVDSGQCGLYDQDYFEQNCGNEDWYDMACQLTYHKEEICFQGGTMDEKGFVTSSGYGDGGYVCFTGRNRGGKVISVRVEFIPFCDYRRERLAELCKASLHELLHSAEDIGLLYKKELEENLGVKEEDISSLDNKDFNSLQNLFRSLVENLYKGAYDWYKEEIPALIGSDKAEIEEYLGYGDLDTSWLMQLV